MTETTQKKPLSGLVERAERIGEDLKVRMNLAGIEAKEAWDRAHLARIGEEITHLRDEAKVQLHLAGMDAKDAWHRLEKRVEEAKGKFGVGADAIVQELSHGIGEVARGLRSGASHLTSSSKEKES
jgi:hypothetical protein